MSSSVLEAQRSALEELERIETAIADRIVYNPGVLPDSAPLSASSELHGKRKQHFRKSVLQQQEIGRFIKRYKQQCEFLEKSYTPKSALRQQQQLSSSSPDKTVDNDDLDSHPAVLRDRELTAISTTSDARITLLDVFYKQIYYIKEYHRKYPNQQVDDLSQQYQMGIVKLKEQQEMLENGVLLNSIDDADPAQQTAIQALLNAQNLGSNVLLSTIASDIDLDSMFSGEEAYGKYLDLVSFHERYINLPFILEAANEDFAPSSNGASIQAPRIILSKLTYLRYLDIFYDFSNPTYFPVKRKSDKEYFTYASELHQYIRSFFVKRNILENTQTTLQKIEADFENAWTKKIPFSGWRFDDSEKDNLSSSSSTNKPADGVETPEGFFCTPCNKYFAKETVYKGHLNGKKHIKNAAIYEKENGNGNSSSSSDDETNLRHRLLAFHEYCTFNLIELLQKQVTDTKNNVERKRALTDNERKLEIEALDSQDDLNPAGNKKSKKDSSNDDEDEDEEIIYNPLKLPLGWDGKPIPFWLWKLNGLGIEYSCEICGNYVYMGRKAFEKHFMEARHVHGLKCLGITQTLLFKGIVNIQDALDLWNKIKRTTRQEEGRRENAVEMEDEEGNVMSEKVYNDLKKQGLL